MRRGRGWRIGRQRESFDRIDFTVVEGVVLIDSAILFWG